MSSSEKSNVMHGPLFLVVRVVTARRFLKDFFPSWRIAWAKKVAALMSTNYPDKVSALIRYLKNSKSHKSKIWY